MKIVYMTDNRPGRFGRWYWHMQAKNGCIVCDGAEGYASRRNVLRAVNRFRSFLSVDVPVVELK